MKVLVYHPRPHVRQQYEALIGAVPEAALLRWQDEAELEAAVQEAEALFCWALPAALWAKAAKLRWVQSLGAGVEDIVRHAPEGVLITRVEGLFGPWMAEYVFAHLLARLQRVAEWRGLQREHRWQPDRPLPLHGLHLGIAGMGAIGGHIARVANAFGMRVSGWSRTGSPRQGVDMYGEEQLPAFLSNLDVAVLVLPLTRHTYHRFGAAELSALPRGAGVINIGRGAVIDERALMQSLQEGHLGWAVLDVFEQEPLPPTHPLWDMPQVTITPHVSGPSVPSEVGQYCAEQLARHVAGQPLRGVVDRARGY